MCGRFNLVDSPAVIVLMQQLGFRVDDLVPRGDSDRYNLAPTDTVLLAGQDDTGRFLRSMQWWLTPHWAPDLRRRYSLFNARSDSLQRSSAFRDAFRYRRGIIPASSFIEWRQEGAIRQPYRVRPPGPFCFFAAIWDVWTRQGHLESCAIITTEASPEMRPLHDRMPALLRPEQFERWLDPRAEPASLAALLAPVQLEGWKMARLSPVINNARQKIREADQPVEEGTPLSAGMSWLP